LHDTLAHDAVRLLLRAASLGFAATWAPRGVLLAHLAEHKRAVNAVAVSQNGAFFVTASADETCKVWDCRRLEKDVAFRSKLTYASQARARLFWLRPLSAPGLASRPPCTIELRFFSFPFFCTCFRKA
jgi:phosphoinositide-3-kinase regulatory subunit 4